MYFYRCLKHYIVTSRDSSSSGKVQFVGLDFSSCNDKFRCDLFFRFAPGCKNEECERSRQPTFFSLRSIDSCDCSIVLCTERIFMELSMPLFNAPTNYIQVLFFSFSFFPFLSLSVFLWQITFMQFHRVSNFRSANHQTSSSSSSSTRYRFQSCMRATFICQVLFFLFAM